MSLLNMFFLGQATGMILMSLLHWWELREYKRNVRRIVAEMRDILTAVRKQP